MSNLNNFCKQQIPRLNNLKGYVSEIHGSHNTGKTKFLLEYVLENQKLNNNFICAYIDTGTQLRNCSVLEKINKDKIWFIFLNRTILLSDTIIDIAKQTDLIIIDDFTNLNQNPWSLLKNLQKIAKKTNVTILLANQLRYVIFKCNNTIQTSYQPYRYNVIKSYCKYSIDLDTNEIINFNQNLNLAIGEELNSLLI